MNQVILVPGRPGFEALLWWFQGPSDDPLDYSFELDGKPHLPAEVVNVDTLLSLPVKSAARQVAARTFLAVTSHPNEKDGTPHRLQVFHRHKDPSNLADSRTLPSSANGLVMVLASCFCLERSRLHKDSPLASDFMGQEDLPHVKMLCGDQIYLDLVHGLLPMRTLEDPLKRYQEQWQDPDFIAWMARGGNLCMADDHEFWNNYPSVKRLGAASFVLNTPPSNMATAMEEAFLVYQAVLNIDPTARLRQLPFNQQDLHCFEFPGALAPPDLYRQFALQVLDTRTQRSDLADPAANQQCTQPTWLADTITRITQRKGPSMLVTSQSLLDRGGDSESNLADYRQQFEQLWDAIRASQHQLLLLTGDIHWSRAQRFSAHDPKVVHHEVVSSALARIRLPTTKWPDLDSTVRWNGHSVSAQRIADCYVEHTYATLHFSTRALGLRCTVRWWEIDGDGQHRRIDMAAGLLGDLKALFATQKMEVPIDLS